MLLHKSCKQHFQSQGCGMPVMLCQIVPEVVTIANVSPWPRLSLLFRRRHLRNRHASLVQHQGMPVPQSCERLAQDRMQHRELVMIGNRRPRGQGGCVPHIASHAFCRRTLRLPGCESSVWHAPHCREGLLLMSILSEGSPTYDGKACLGVCGTTGVLSISGER